MAKHDKYAATYTSDHNRRAKYLTGFDLDYFNRYKIKDLERECVQHNIYKPKKIMDFGCGVGNSLPLINELFPMASIFGFDVSSKSIKLAKEKIKSGKNIYASHIEKTIFSSKPTYDIIFSSCVFHHIDSSEHTHWLKQLYSNLKPGGILLIYEHNPINPLTQFIFRTDEADKEGSMISSRRLKMILMEAGFINIFTRYRVYFPSFLTSLIRFEDYLKVLPLGAQYYCFAVK
jgi:SAM-dependent methyltransferase